MKRSLKSGSNNGEAEQIAKFRSALSRPVGELHTIPETAEILQTSERTVLRLIASGQLGAHRFRRLVRISDADIAAMLEATRTI